MVRSLLLKKWNTKKCFWTFLNATLNNAHKELFKYAFFLIIIWLLTLLTLNNGVFPAIVQRSYVQLRDRSTVPVQHGTVAHKGMLQIKKNALQPQISAIDVVSNLIWVMSVNGINVGEFIRQIFGYKMIYNFKH